jgi:hypothetical protein
LQHFDPRFHEKHELFWPIARAAAPFARDTDWPGVDTYGRAFSPLGRAPVRFELAAPAGRRRGKSLDTTRLYDARITRDGSVPTRERSWHDFLNALVWATFPRAKHALHERQHRVLQARIPAGARTLPARRSREHDALALIDEGGVVLIEGAGGRASSMVLFGHAIYEGLVLGRGAMTACGVRVHVDALPPASEQIALADAALLELLTRDNLDPSRLHRVPIPAAAAETAAAASPKERVGHCPGGEGPHAPS